MRKLFLGLGLIALLAGCASQESGDGMGGTSDQYNQNSGTSNSSGQYQNDTPRINTDTNSVTGQGDMQ